MWAEDKNSLRETGEVGRGHVLSGPSALPSVCEEFHIRIFQRRDGATRLGMKLVDSKNRIDVTDFDWNQLHGWWICEMRLEVKGVQL